jgi:hypothetical protein
VRGQVQVFDDAAGQDHGVVAVADVHPGADGVHGGGAAADLVAGLDYDYLAPGAR